MVRKYVDVICLNDHTGNLKPLCLIWDESRKIPIEKVTAITPRSSLKTGGSGLRYTCLFAANVTRHLNYDRGKWFVEMNDPML